MNELQKNIYKIIVSIIQTDSILKNFKDTNSYGENRVIDNSAIRYGILNYVAKYSLAKNEYLITTQCYEHIKKLGLLKRGNLLRGSKGTKHKFTFEHPIPSNIIADHIIENIADKGRIKMILQETDLVTAITYSENNLINKSGFIKEMPPGSYENKDMFARYKMSGVEVPSKKIEVYGALKR